MTISIHILPLHPHPRPVISYECHPYQSCDHFRKTPLDKYKKWKRVEYTDKSGKIRCKLISETRGNKEGFRFVGLEMFESFIENMTMHIVKCPHALELKCPITVLGEVWSSSLASFIAVKCQGCGKYIELRSPRMPDKQFEINVRATWGQMVTGGGCANLNEQCATMGMPGMNQSTFTAIEDMIGKLWKQVHMHIFFPFFVTKVKQLILLQCTIVNILYGCDVKYASVPHSHLSLLNMCTCRYLKKIC